LLEPLDPPTAMVPLPVVVPVLCSDQVVSPAQDALLTGLARRARLGDRAARDLLWRALAPRLEPALLRCGRLAWQSGGARRDGWPWELEDARQEAWLVFAQLVEWWSGEGSFIPYAITYFPWRLRGAMRRLGPQRRVVPIHPAPEPEAECQGLLDNEGEELLASIAAVLSPIDAEILRLRIEEGSELADIACRLGFSRRTMTRRWQYIQSVARDVLANPAPHRQVTGQ
ncbi:MAG: sigma-70 family RNA polymerase sigma factor, partial [Chloroflexi bacterium]|nr:sigma-70 family RNA polymerase sigma factor [Chloroflexota bacterium]